MGKITRSRTGCFTCKQRRRKCDETKPECNNCINSNRKCAGYGIRLVFDVDDIRNDELNVNSKGEKKYGFRGRPRMNDTVQQVTLQTHSFESQQVHDQQTTIEQSTSEQTQTMQLIGITPSNQNTNTNTKSISDIDITDPFQFENALYDGLDYLLNVEEIQQQEIQQQQQQQQQEIQQMNYQHYEPILSPIITNNEITNLYPESTTTTTSKLSISLNYKEENFLLKHFFNKLIYLLDAHPSTPWPELMMKFGSFELAKSCFLSLSSMHLYVNNGENEFYQKGILHINNTMEYLIKYIVINLKNQSTKRKQTNFFVILLLLYVHLLFAILESGRSALSRIFLKLFASIAQDQTFEKVLNKIDQSQTLICVLSWFDTVSAIISPDCRLPFCKIEWYGTMNDLISTAKMNGCPGELFKIL
ncbi:hypothetical protein CANARDRAFT_191074, partial [[Candida] arabinofermentans NRRL YB-2248]